MKPETVIKVFCEFGGFEKTEDFLKAYSDYFKEKPLDEMSDSEVLLALKQIWEFWRRPDLGIPFFQGAEGDSSSHSSDEDSIGKGLRQGRRKKKSQEGT